jgi:hypothetical protein
MSVKVARFTAEPLAREWRTAPLTRNHRHEAGRRYDHLAASLNADPRNAAAGRELESIVAYLDRYRRLNQPVPWGWESVA